MRKLTILFSIALLVTLIAPAVPGTFTTTPAQAQTTTLRMGLLPILDVLPFYVAQEAGYFADGDLEVELVPVSSALERDQLMLAGEIDGMLNDLISTAIFNQDATRIQVVAQARRAYDDAPQFRILAAPRSNITLPSDAAQFEIAISENSVIHYIAQRIMEANGVSAGDLTFRPEPNIPVRYQLLMEGAIQVAVLPDPLAQAAIEGGAILIADDTDLVESEFSQSVLSFRTEVIEDNPDAVTLFLDAWMRAAQDINDNPEAYRALWIDNTNVPDSVRDSYVLPPFPTYAITQESAWNDTVEWLVAEDIIDAAPDYADSVNAVFIETIAPAVIEDDSLPGNPANGAAVFDNYGCIGCHAVEGDAAGVGPSLAGLAERAGDMVPGQDAVEYVRVAIVEPGAHVVEGYDNIMAPYDLNDDDLIDLIAYLLTLE